MSPGIIREALVIVLKNVPPIKPHEQESWKDLNNKVTYWFNGKLPYQLEIIRGIIMVRRVSWVGKSKKLGSTDFVIINFNNAGTTLNGIPHIGIDIQAVTLGFFYPPCIHSLEPLYLGNHHRPLEFTSLCNGQAGGAGPSEICLANRFEALSSLEAVD